MKKILYIFSCLFFYLTSSAQFQGVLVTYKEVFDTDRPIQRLAYLYSTPNFSVFEEDFNTTKKIHKEKELIEVREIIVYEPSNQENLFVISYLDDSKTESFDYLVAEKKSKILDKVKLNWKLIDEKQFIDKMECYKAIVDFRGRKWIAWYAPTIPFSSGPYKFHGLPGLIIKLNDDTNEFNYVVEKIEFLDEGVYDKKMAEVKSIPFNQQHTLQEFTLQREQILENGFNSVNKERGFDLVRNKMPRNGIELKYEWEE